MDANRKDPDPERTKVSKTDIDAGPLPIDVLLSLLADQQRRHLLRYLVASHDQIVTLEQCIQYIRHQEENTIGENPGDEQVKLTLHHCHIPKLEEFGILEYDTQSQEIQYQGHKQLETWFNRIEGIKTDLDY